MFGIDDAIAAGLKILDKFVPDPEARARAEGELRASLMEWDRGQMTVNTAEAGHRSLFVAGWRPWIGWVCGIAFAWHFVAQPLFLFGLAMTGKMVPLPAFDMTSLLTVMMGMLGLGGLRTFEKMKGLTK